MKIYDSLIIGGGPAGLSASIYLARFKRQVLVIDRHFGRSTYHQVNENYFGFPKGISSRDLRILGRKQARRFGVEFVTDTALSIKKENNAFFVSGKSVYAGKTVIFATGVNDIFPEFRHRDQYVGRSLFWCITCDGYKTIGKKVVVVGHDDEAAVTCMQFLNYTRQLLFVTNTQKSLVTKNRVQNLEAAGIPYLESQIQTIEGKNGKIHKVILSNGQVLAADYIFSQQGCTPNAELAVTLGVLTDDKKFILTDDEQRTNIPLVYAAGDVTKIFSHQVVTAAHEGSMAAQAANYDLYRPEQRE